MNPKSLLLMFLSPSNSLDKILFLWTLDTCDKIWPYLGPRLGEGGRALGGSGVICPKFAIFWDVF
jgi:hypothetical protein